MFVFTYLIFYLSLVTVDSKNLDNMYKKTNETATVANQHQLSYLHKNDDTEVKLQP